MKARIVIIIFILIGKCFAYAQEEQIIPIDSCVKIGVLDNGLTYYIRYNKFPAKRADFYIAQKVGSILEEEHQRGLAHFLEHMCFNGTSNFLGESLVEELEKKGIKFGVNLNASTSIDETVYNLTNIPVNREGIIDTALLVLHDWSGYVLLNEKDIDDERGIIREEWRTRNTAGQRVMEKTIENIFPGSRYANRIPIGLMEVVDNFPYQALKDYYKKWYRPDLQAIIVVGDIDVEQVETKIKNLFSDIPLPENPAPREEFDVPENTEPIVSITTDPEIQQTNLSVYLKREWLSASEKKNTNYYETILKENLVTAMFNQRMYEIAHQPNPPFNNGGGNFGSFSVAKNPKAWALGVIPRNNQKWEKALKTLIIENERISRFGFTESELERAKTNMISSFRSSYREYDKRNNRDFIQLYVKNFLEDEPIPAFEWTFNFVSEFLQNLKLEQINKLASSLVSDTNMVFTFIGPENEEITTPTKTEIIKVWKESKNAEIEPYKDDTTAKQLLGNKPQKGEITKQQQQAFGYTQWELSNGVKVLYKKTDYKKDEIVISAYSHGGVSLIDEKDLPSSTAINDLALIGGVGSLSQVDLKKVLTGKKVNISTFVNGVNEGFNASTSPGDFESMLQLIFLIFTAPRIDETAFVTWKTNKKDRLVHSSLNPMKSLQDTLASIIANNHPRSLPFNMEMLDKIDYDKTISLFKQRFSNAGDFTFFITGNIDVDRMKPHIETYLGGLPSTHQNEEFIDWNMYPPKGIIKKHFYREMQTPKSSIVTIYSGEIPFSLENIILMDYLKSILNIVYTEVIREKEGGSYGVSVNGNLSKTPTEQFLFQVQFDTDPELRKKLLKVVYREIKNIQKHNPDIENVDKVRKYLLKSHREKTTSNMYWQSIIQTYTINGIDLSSDYEKIVSSITPSMVSNFAKQIFSQKNIIEVSMNPTE